MLLRIFFFFGQILRASLGTLVNGEVGADKGIGTRVPVLERRPSLSKELQVQRKNRVIPSVSALSF